MSYRRNRRFLLSFSSVRLTALAVSSLELLCSLLVSTCVFETGGVLEAAKAVLENILKNKLAVSAITPNLNNFFFFISKSPFCELIKDY